MTPARKLSRNFAWNEVTASGEAARRGIDNDLPIDLRENAYRTAEMMERIRAALSEELGKPAPILVLSWYRCPDLNTVVGSGAGSHHLTADAVDWHCPAFGRPSAVAAFLAKKVDELGIGQLINEFPSPWGGWVHTSRLQVVPRNRVITITKAGTTIGVTRA